MAISEAMLAQALTEYLQQHAGELSEFLFDRFEEGDGYVTLSGDRIDRMLSLMITKLSQDGSIVSEHRYSIRVERND
jgi:hypothetical protein